MDDVDRSTERMAVEEELRRREVRPADPVQPTGLCHYCEAEVRHPKKFCDGDCASAHATEQRIRRAQGRTR